MTEQKNKAYSDDEISLLDILITLAESWKLLVFGPLITGVLAAGVSFLWPKTFESVAIVRFSEEEVALLHAAPVLDELILKYELRDEAGGLMDDARQALKARIFTGVDKKTKLATITVKDRTPEAAHALCNAAIVALIKELQVKGQEKILIEKTIAINNRGIATAEDVIETIQRSLKKVAISDSLQESAIKNLATINTYIIKLSQENEELRQKLEPRGAEVYVQEPSLPQRKSAPRHTVVVLFTVLLTGLALFLFVFIRKAIVLTALDPKNFNKLAAIRAALCFQNNKR